MDLINEYGPLGSAIFDCILCMIYREGYYLELPIDKLCLAVVRAIGGKWVKKHQVMQVIQYCADIGLFDKSLLARSVVTSAGLQRRYAEVTSRNKVDKSLYWLIDDYGQPLKAIPENAISATEMPISATEMPISAAEMQQETEIRNKNKSQRESQRAACAAAPSLAEVKAYCDEKGFTVDPERFWNYYETLDWEIKGQPVRNWKALLSNWDRSERSKPPKHEPSYDLEEYEKYDIFSRKEQTG